MERVQPCPAQAPPLVRVEPAQALAGQARVPDPAEQPLKFLARARVPDPAEHPWEFLARARPPDPVEPAHAQAASV